MLVLLLACVPDGPAFVASAAFDGPAVRVDPADGERDVPFAVEVRPIGAGGDPAPRVDFGFDVAWTVRSDAPATVRFVTYTDAEDVFVPTPWEVRVDGEDTFAQSSDAHGCPRGEAACAAAYDLAIEVREGDAVDVLWTIAAWVEGRPGSADKVEDADIAVEFE